MVVRIFDHEEQELTVADVVSEAEVAATEAQGVVERPVEPIAEREARWDSEGALGVDGHAEGCARRYAAEDELKR